jgi:cyclohexanone monooxygenase
MMQASAKRSHFTNTADVVVIGAGFAGLLALQRLVEIGLSVQAFEAAAGVGETWYYNRYPGARCDSEVPLYQYFFSDELAAEWRWSERYPAQAEILAYLNFVADRCDLRRHIMFETEVISLQYEEDCGRWTATTNRGDIISAQYCVTAVGCLSAPIVPNISGIGSFKKEIYFTSSWPHEGADFKDKQVAVIGTGRPCF